MQLSGITWFPSWQHYEVAMSAHSQVGIRPDVTLDVARVQDNDKPKPWAVERPGE